MTFREAQFLSVTALWVFGVEAKRKSQFDIVCTVHRNQFYKQTNKMHFLYVFILQSFCNSTCFERPFRSSSGVHKFTVSAAVYNKFIVYAAVYNKFMNS